MQVIPSIDLMAGKCVRLTEGDFSAKTEYTASALELALRYSKSGATQIHLVDLDGAKSGQIANLGTIRAITALSLLEVQAGGGVRKLDDVKALLEAGCARAVVGSVAVLDPDAVAGWARELGPEKICVALDLRDGLLATRGWQDLSEKSLGEALAPLFDAGIRRFLCTDIRKDGKLAGPNVELYAGLVADHPEAEWIASGGVTTDADLDALERAGVYGAVIGKALYEGTLRIESCFKPRATEAQC